MLSNVEKVTDLFSKATEGIEKWIKATTSAQNSRILGAALSDAGMGAAVGAVGGLFTDQGITEGALSGAILGAGAGALMKRSQILESKGSTKNVDRMRRQRDSSAKIASNAEKKAAEERANIQGYKEELARLGSNGKYADAHDQIKVAKSQASKADRVAAFSRKRAASLTKSVDAERAAISQTLSTSATGAGAVGGLASLAFATLDSNRV